MNRFTKIKYPATLLPIIAMSISMASADEIKSDCDESSAGLQSSPSTERVTATTTTTSPTRSAQEVRTKNEAKTHASMHHYLADQPDDAYFTTNLIGQDVMNRRDNSIVGEVSELLIDSSGRISALVIGTGGLLGLGEKDLAIAWSQIERVIDGDEVTLSVDLSDGSLDDAPAFARR